MTPSKRPPPVPHDWRRVHLSTRVPWGFLATTGPHERTYVAGDGTIDGLTYECERCGCVRLFAWLYVDNGDGTRSQQQVPMHGFDWDSLAPMRAPSCEALERPVHAEAVDDELEQFEQGAAA